MGGTSNTGYFIGEPRVILLPDGRGMRMLCNFIFVDTAGIRWIIEKGEVTNGADIPRLLWPVAGGPFEGKHRIASIFHDKYCRTKERSWRDTHWMFYEAMLAAGVREFEADLKYIAVYRFGPRWDDDGNKINVPRQPVVDQESGELLGRDGGFW